ncbi:hypothetical protein [Vulcanisaeta souniana]|uniref:Uncharacterized protein n=1 Tax=Vulcanisaeta souniana JCM 11219 TaxID=1293586 RepID=A0A830E9H7_9CREN|nr:hypothetical protein [Vulcanisaeta souniana]GGI84390.1 hypothetical protein GCM10007112_21680 [Vulcanisaeta souniana JCM 11219]
MGSQGPRLEVRGICNGFVIDECPGINKEHYVTYPDGAYTVARVNAIKRAMPDGKPFIDETFLYLDDNLLGLILWNKGYQVKYVPIDAGMHYVSKTTRGFLSDFYGTRSTTALSDVVETRYSNTLISALRKSRRLLYIFINKTRYQGFIDGTRFAKILLKKVGRLNLYCATYHEVTLPEAISELFLLRYRLSKIYTVKLNELKIKDNVTKRCG